MRARTPEQPLEREILTGDEGVARGSRDSSYAEARALIQLRQLIADWKWASFPLILFCCTRIALLGFSYIGLTIIPDLYVPMGDRDMLRHYPALDGLCRWDCWHLGRIAQEGYTEPVWTNFFPLYPLLAHAVTIVTGIPIYFALLLVANIAGLGAFLVIYRVFVRLAGEEAARASLVLFAAYPFAFFQAAGYPESLMIFFSALAILLALRGNHLWAGLALGLGVLTRHVTLFAGGGLLAAQIRQRGIHPRRLLLNPSIIGLLLPWLFLSLYCLYQYIVFGNPLAFAAARDQPPWGPMAWWGIDDLLMSQETNRHVQVMYSYLPFAILISIGALALLRNGKWIEVAVFALSFLIAVWAVGMWGFGRYTAACWPAFLPFGAWLAKKSYLQGPVVTILGLFQGLFFFLFSHQYMIL